MPYVIPNQPNPNAEFVRELTKDLLLAALTKGISLVGKVPTAPTPGNMGQLQFPSGASTRISPTELSQLQARGTVPTRTGTPLPFGGTGGASYQQPTRLGFGPDLTQQTAQADIDFKRQQTQSLRDAPRITWVQDATGNLVPTFLPPEGAGGVGASPQPTHYPDPTTGQLIMELGGKKYKVTGIDPKTGQPLYDPL